MLDIYQQLLSPVIVVPLLILTIYLVYDRLLASSSTPSGVPWVGKGSSRVFSQTKASFLSLTHMQEWMAEGYKSVY